MTPVAPPSPAVELVARVLTTPDSVRRTARNGGVRGDSEGLREAVLALCDEAVKLFGVDPVKMQRLCDDAGALADRSGDPYLKAMALMRSGDAARAQGRHAEACKRYDAAAERFRLGGLPVDAARTRIGWVWAAANLGRVEEAVAAARSARRVFVAHGADTLLAQLELNTGNIYAEHGFYPRALLHYRSAQTLFDALGEAGRLQAARCHANRGRVLLCLGDQVNSLRELELARNMHEQLGEFVAGARVRRTIGESQMDRGDYAGALRAFDRALSVFRELGMWSAVVTVGCDLADCYLHLSRPTDALLALDGVEQDLRHIDSVPDALGIAVRRVAAYLQLDETGAALTAAEEAELRHPDQALQHRSWLALQRAKLLHRDGDSTAALSLALRAAQLARNAGVRRLLHDALVVQGGAMLALGLTSRAAAVAARSLRLSRSLASAPALYGAHDLLGRVAEQQGRPQLAGQHYATAIEHLDDERRGVIFEYRDSFASSRSSAYERLVAIQLAEGKPDDALATAERAKSRALSDAITGVIQLKPRGGPATRRWVRALNVAREQYAAMSARCAREQGAGEGTASERAMTARQLVALERRVADLVRAVQLHANADDQTDLLVGNQSPPRPPLPVAAMMVEFFLIGNDIVRFVIDQRGVRGRVISDALPEVERNLRALRLNLDAAQRNPAGISAALHAQLRAILGRLHRLLLADLDFNGVTSLVVVPHGLLHYLPFHAFCDTDQYLVERLSVTYAPSLALYEICLDRAERKRKGKALVLAHSAGGRLPCTLAEATAVASVLGVPVYREEAATRALLAAEGRSADVIHIAAHGRFRSDAPLFSHLELGDGPLTTADLFNLDLRVRLIVLSACETGRSVIGGGDELVGLTRALLYAGSAGLLVSQWRVEDEATANLMLRFHQAWRGGATGAQALREAQVQHLRESVGSGRDHPYYWAGFQYIGGERSN